MKRRRWFKTWSLSLGIFFIFALFCVWVRVQVLETGYQLRRLEEEGERLKAENHALTVEWATLRSPRRLQQVARSLGLQRPHEDQVTLLKGGS